MIQGGLGCLAVWRSKAGGIWVLPVSGVLKDWAFVALVGFRLCGSGVLCRL